MERLFFSFGSQDTGAYLLLMLALLNGEVDLLSLVVGLCVGP